MAYARSQIQEILLHSKLGSEEERMKLISEIDSIRERFASLKIKSKSFDAELAQVIYVLRTYSSLPTSLEACSTIDDMPGLQSFIQASRALIAQDHTFAYNLLRRLAKSNQNTFLQAIVNSPRTIDLGNRPIQATLLGTIATLHPQLTSLTSGPILGNAINLEGCSPKIVTSILKALPNTVNEVALSSDFFSTPECQQLVDENEAVKSIAQNVVALVVRPAEGQRPPVAMKSIEMRRLMTMLPSVKDLRLPPLTFADDPQHPAKKMHMMEDFHQVWEYTIDFDEAFRKCDERVQHEIIRAFAQGATKDADSTIHWLKGVPFDRLLPLWILNAKDNKTTLQSVEKSEWNGLHGHFLDGPKGQELCHVLLSTDKLTDLTVLPGFWIVDFSHNPLLDDKQLIDFLRTKGSLGLSNAEKLHYFKLRGCESLSDEAIPTLLKESPHLGSLDLSDCVQLTDKAFMHLPKNCLYDLKSLDLRNTGISYGMVTTLKQQYPQLSILYDEKAICGNALAERRKQEGDLTLTAADESQEKVHHTLFPQSEKLPFSHRALRLFIKYRYTHSLGTLDKETAGELIRYSKVKDSRLYNDCVRWLMRTMTPQNVFERLEMAKQQSIPELLHFSRRYLDLTCHPDTLVHYAPQSQSAQDIIFEQLRLERPAESKEKVATVTNVNPITPDINIEIITTLSGEPLVIPANTIALASRSAYFLKALKESDQKLILKSERPQAVKLIVNALMSDSLLSFKGMSLQQVLELLKEADHLNAAHIVIDDHSLVEWLREHKDEIDFADPDWSKLLDWAKAHNNPRIGMRFVILANLFLPKYTQDPFVRAGLENLMASDSFSYFEKMALQHQGTARMSELYVLPEESINPLNIRNPPQIMS